MCGLITSIARIKKSDFKIKLVPDGGFFNFKTLRPLCATLAKPFTEFQAKKSLFPFNNHIGQSGFQNRNTICTSNTPNIHQFCHVPRLFNISRISKNFNNKLNHFFACIANLNHGAIMKITTRPACGIVTPYPNTALSVNKASNIGKGSFFNHNTICIAK